MLQSLVWPDPALHPDPALSFRLGTGASVCAQARQVRFEPGGSLGLDTAYNIFSWIKWRNACDIGQLDLVIAGAGQFVLQVVSEQPEARQVLRLDLDLTDGRLRRIDLTKWLEGRDDSVLHVVLRAVSAGHIATVDWCTPQNPRRRPRLLLCVTTFHRPEAATATALRINAALQDHPLADDLHLLMVDNDRSLTLPPLTHVTLVGNRNLGGAGGFARGLSEAVARGCSHCLFMDDDAWVDFASVARTWTFLANVTDPAVAVAGTLTRADAPTTVWESTAFFDGRCRLVFADMNLLDADDLAEVEFASCRPARPNTYGGFWYFAFPVAAVRHWPFPFFVRGDDINFSIVNPFRILTLPGVISYQALDFTDKETSLTQYLNLRCDLLQVLLLPLLPHRFLWALRSPASFFLRALVLLRIDSLHALNLAIEDVLRGPALFAANADLAARRAELANKRQHEVWMPVEGSLPAERRHIDPNAPWQRFVMKYTLSGLFLPFFSLWGNHVTLPRNHRKAVRQCWGASQITFVAPDGKQAMTLRQDKWAALREGVRMTRNIARLAFGYRSLRKRFGQEFPYLTSAAFWHSQFRDQPPKS